ncbi:MAG: BatD family protein [Candidatus Omnitrophota bacterium]
MKKIIPAVLTFLIISYTPAFAEVSIETSVSRSRLGVGEELTLDIIVSGAAGGISKPTLPSLDGFSSYSRGHSQEITIISGRTTARSVFSYVLIANAAGKKVIGPLEVVINGVPYQAAPVEVEVVQGGSPYAVPTSGPVVAPPSRALPGTGVTNQDIFVKAWLDKDEVYVNEPAMLTYTIYTRLTSTYKGFEKEPVTTGFWVEDFPPEKTIRRTEQIFNGSRYVVADIRKLALFPTQVGVFTIEPGTIATTVEVRDQQDFDSFFSYNVFGRRSPYVSSTYHVFSKKIPTDPILLTVRALPEKGKPAGFSGAVGDYKLESSIDKSQVEVGTPVTYRLRISGQGNINTLQMPAFPPIVDFKIYDSSSSANISKNRLIVEGEKVTETVLVPRKAGTYTIPALAFSTFDPKSGTYKEMKTSSHTLVVKPSIEAEEPAAPEASVESVEKEEVRVVGRDIRYLKEKDRAGMPFEGLHRNPLYWAFNGAILFTSFLIMIFSKRRQSLLQDLKAARFRRSGRVARAKLKKTAQFLRQDRRDEFYTEIDRAVRGYFADKLNLAAQMVSVEAIEQGIPAEEVTPEIAAEIKALFHELSMGRFARIEKTHEDMKQVYAMSERVINLFEKVKLR